MSPSAASPTTPAPSVPENAPAERLVYFHYLGQTPMSVAGPVTGRIYDFGREGAVVGVDYRDAETLARISHLRLISVRRGRPGEG